MQRDYARHSPSFFCSRQVLSPITMSQKGECTMKMKKDPRTAVTVLEGAGIGLVTVVLISMLLGILVVKGVVPEGMMPHAGTAAVIIGSSLGVLFSTRGPKKLLNGLITGAALLLFLLLLHGIAFREQAYVWLPSMLGVLATALITSVLRSLKKKKRHY